MQACDLASLTAGGAPYRALSCHELRAVIAMLHAKALNAQDVAIPADLDTVKENSACFVCIPEKQKEEIKTFLACKAAVAAGAAEDCADIQALIEEAKLWAKTSPQELAAAELYLDCAEVNISGIGLGG